ncbi:MAG: urea ABC transporter permease subunit UrtC [Acidobacteriota bacterium]|nr:urea ABC transporter permease subunit UrtC [Acidobacteriota bacterium]
MPRREFLVHLLVLGVLALGPWWLSPYNLSLLGRFLAMSILALGLTVVWGWGGFLSLGQGVFFGLGGYALAMNLKLAGLAPGDLPDFMVWSGLDHLPWWWAPFRHPVVALAAVVLVPAAVAGLFAWLVFHRRVRGVYFALLTQAFALALATLLISQQAYTGGFNGLTDYGPLFGVHLTDASAQTTLYAVTLGALCACYGLATWLSRSHFGRLLVAIRDGENRVRCLGYDTVPYKVAAFALAGAFAGVAGALFAAQVGVISPAMVGVVPSIEMLIWVAVGGRESLAGAVLGCLLVNFGKDWVSSAMPSVWLFVMGGLFIVVVTVLPQGIGGLLARRSAPGPAADAAPMTPEPAGP